MKVYHIAYEPSYESLDIHFWTGCNLQCRGCYLNYEKLDFGLLDDPVAHVVTQNKEAPPQKFLSYDEVMAYLEPLKIKYAIFMGDEAALDPELPKLTRTLHQKFNSYNIILTNGRKLIDLENIDEVIFSIKAISEDIHRDYTGHSNKTILENFAKIYRAGKKLQAETVLIPEYIDAREVERVAKFVASVDKDITFRIDSFFEVPDCPWRSATKEEVAEAEALARKHLSNVNCLTLDMKRVGDKAVRVF
jgi:pyruvate-formate lyase-activating enzyme